MAIVFTSRGSTSSTVDTQTPTVSITSLASGTVMQIMMWGRRTVTGTEAPTPSDDLTGTGSYSLVTSANSGSDGIWTWTVTGLSGSGTVTLTFSTDTLNFYGIFATEIAGANSTPVQSKSGITTTSAAPNTVQLAFDSTTSASNSVLAGVGCRGGAYQATAQSGWSDDQRVTVSGSLAFERHSAALTAETQIESTWDNGSTPIGVGQTGIEWAPSAALGTIVVTATNDIQ